MYLGSFILSSYAVIVSYTPLLSPCRPQVTPRPRSPGDGSSSNNKFNKAPQNTAAAPLSPSASLGKLLSAVPAPLLGLAAGAAVTAVTAGAAVAAGASLSTGGLGPLGPPLSALQLNGTRGGNVLQLPSLLPAR